ncbi:MAG: phage holin family protein [Ilumatobacteraceae bacterium]
MAEESPSPNGADRPSDDPGRSGDGSTESPNEVFQYVVAYAKQETLGPLRGAGRWLGAGVVGALLLGLGSLLLLVGLLRLLQTEWDRSATGSLSWLSYLIVLVVAVLLLVVALKRINREPLDPALDSRTSAPSKDER